MYRSRPALLAVVALLIGFGAGYLIGLNDRRPVSAPSPVEQPAAFQEAKASVMLDFGDDKIKTALDLPFSAGATALDILKIAAESHKLEVQTKDYGNLGIMVIKIGERENGQGEKYWQYWVNNRHPDVGAGAYLVQPDDVIEWKFTSAQWE